MILDLPRNNQVNDSIQMDLTGTSLSPVIASVAYIGLHVKPSHQEGEGA